MSPSADAGNGTHEVDAGSEPDAEAERDGAASTDAGAPDASDAPDAASHDDAGEDASCPATAILGAGDTTQTMTFGGIARTYLVHMPASYTGTEPVPVVFDLHPLGVSAMSWKDRTEWSTVADREGFIAVWPQGFEDSWNAGRCCDPAFMAGVDDVGFVRAILSQLMQDACVDLKRVYASGCSNGGGMAYRLACDAADVIAAVAPVDFDCITGPANDPSCASCTPARPISERQFRGLLDPLVPYSGGETSVVAGLIFPGARANFETWGAINACTGTPEADPMHATCRSYPTCAGGVETTLCTIPLGTHCVSYNSFGIVNLAWETFSRQSLP